MVEAGRTYRFFVPDLTAHACGNLLLALGEAHHARDVLRVRVGQMLELFDGAGAAAPARVVELARRTVQVEIGQVRALEPSWPALHVAFAAPKGKRLDWLLEKATELGVRCLQPVVFQRSGPGEKVSELSPAARQRWQVHCIAAAKQCGLSFLPEIRGPLALENYLQETRPGIALLGDTSESSVPISAALWDRAQQSPEPSERDSCPVHILLGPEGGLTHSERQGVLQAGFVPVRLGHTTLRIETACIALAACVIAEFS